MKSSTNGKILRGLLSALCFTAFLSAFLLLMANAFNASLRNFLLG